MPYPQVTTDFETTINEDEEATARSDMGYPSVTGRVKNHFTPDPVCKSKIR